MLATAMLLAFALQDAPAVGGPIGALVKEYQKAEADYKRKKGDNPAPKYLPIFQKAARATKGEQAAEALYWVFRIGTGMRGDATGVAAAEDAARTLLADHPASAKLEPVASALGSGQPWAKDWLREASQKARDPKAKLAATFSLAMVLGAAKESRAEAIKLLQSIMKDSPDSPLSKRAGPQVFEWENLQIGCTVPDFEAVDVDGKSFKLSDYRGKVVVLDFWGFW